MRILMLVNDFGPPWDEAGKNNAREVAKQLARRHEVSVLGLGETDESCTVEGLPVVRVASPGYRGGWKRPLYCAGYARLLGYASRQATALHATAPATAGPEPPAPSPDPPAPGLQPPHAIVCFWETASTGLMAALLRDTLAPSARLLQVVWTDTYRLQLAPPGVWLREHLPNLLFNNGCLAWLAGLAVDARMTTSRYLAGRLGRVAAVGGHGVDVERFRPPEAAPSPQPRASSPEPPVVGYLGHATHAKGLDVLFEAMRPLLEAGRARLRVALSDSPEAAALRAAGFPGTEFAGYADAAAFFGACDLVVVPRRSSYGTASYPNTVLEAMACGRTVVTTRQPGIDELVEDGRTGFLVEPGEPTALRACVGRLLEEAGLRERVGEAARQVVEERFTWEAATDPIEWWLWESRVESRESRAESQNCTGMLPGARLGINSQPSIPDSGSRQSRRVVPRDHVGAGLVPARAGGDEPRPYSTAVDFADPLTPDSELWTLDSRLSTLDSQTTPSDQPFACTVVIARDHSALLDAVRCRGRKGLSVVHLDSHCDLRGWVLDRPRARGRWLRARPPRLDGGNVLAHLAADGWVSRILWWHPAGVGREDDLGTYLEADELPGSAWAAVDGGGDENRWVPMELSDTDATPGPATFHPVVDVLSVDWDFFAPYPTSRERAGAEVGAFLAWLENLQPVPGLIFLCSSPDYASAHLQLFDSLVTRLAKVGRTRPWFQDRPWSGPWGASPLGRVMTGARALARRCLVGLKRLGAGGKPGEGGGQ